MIRSDVAFFGPAPLSGAKKSAIDTARARLLLILGLFMLGFIGLMGRTISLGVGDRASQPLIAHAHKPSVQQRIAPMLPARADIVDRNGEILARSLRSNSLFVRAGEARNAKALARQLAPILGDVSVAELQEKLRGTGFAYLKHGLTPTQKWAVNALGAPSLGFEPTQERIYPKGRLAAHVLGRVGRDGVGLEALEYRFNDRLSSDEGRAVPLMLSMDVRVQYALTDELEVAMRAHQAKGAAGVVLDVNTGEVLAMVSLPDFDPNNFKGNLSANQINRASKGVYELGSIFKAFTFAAALDAGSASLTDRYDATKPLRVSRFTIRDDHAKNRWLSAPEVFAYSSNIGTAQMAVDMGAEKQQQFLRQIGLLDAPSLELVEVSDPLYPQRWGKISTMTISYGHGIAVTPVQAVAGMAALVNGGYKVNATLLKANPYGPLGTQVLAARTSRHMRQLLRLAVAEGTGGAADAPGYRVGGKTGTAEKAVAGGYDRGSLISSFVGVFPMDDPKYAVIALLDEPQGTEATFGYRSAGWTAAPVVRNVVMRVAPLLGVAPRDEDQNFMKAVAVHMEEAR